ncbi:hypothetical protein BH23GEM11_BH23GEM11_07550 [soil metagenome]
MIPARPPLHTLHAPHLACLAALLAGAVAWAGGGTPETAASAAAAVPSAVAAAATVEGPRLISVEVSHDRGVYRLHSVADFTASPEAVFRVLSDYRHVSEISGLIIESGVVDGPGADGVSRVRMTVEGCILFFCRRAARVETLELDPHREIVTTVVPELSDFRAGVSSWHLYPLAAGGTRVDFQTEMTPDFRIPPVSGPGSIQRRMVKDGTDAVGRINEMALAPPR